MMILVGDLNNEGAMMKYGQSRALGSAAALVGIAALLAACDDALVTARDGCETVTQAAQAELDAGRGEGKARVRVSLVSRLNAEGGLSGTVALDGATLYMGNGCTRLENATTPAFTTLETAAGEMVVDALLDADEITHIRLDIRSSQGGPRTYATEKILLDEPIRLERGRRTDIYLSLSPVGTSDQVETRFVAAGTMPWTTTTLLYDPQRGGAVTLPGGFSLDMPVGSVPRATVFGIGEYRSGDVSSTFNVWPENTLNEPVTVRFPVDAARIPQGLAMSDYGGRINGVASATTVEGGYATVTARGFGQIRMGTDRSYIETTGGERTAIRASEAGPSELGALVNNECYRRLLNERANLYATLDRNAGLRVSLCENVPPYVHIIMVNVSRAGLSQYGLYPRIVFPGLRATTTSFYLREITTHMSTLSNDFAAINGFTWDGASGCCGGQGTPIGTVYMNGERVSPWFSGTEVIIGFGPHSGSTGTPTGFFERVSGASINIGGYTNWMVPSTTSIVKNGACSRAPGGEVNRWSTAGIGNGVLVMASSVSNTTTTAYELCSVYEGLNVLGGALRLDGGPSAAIWWQGTTLNLLTGTDYAVFGYERQIPYAVAAVTQ